MPGMCLLYSKEPNAGAGSLLCKTLRDWKLSTEFFYLIVYAVEFVFIRATFKRIKHQLGNTFTLLFLNPRVVIAGVPKRMPDGSMGLRGSSAIIFLLSVIPTLSSSVSAS